MHAHIHPSRHRFTALLAIGSVDHHIEIKVSGGVTRMAITVPRAPSPLKVLPTGDCMPAVSAGMTRPSSLLRAHAPDLNPLTGLRSVAWSASLGRLLRTPAGTKALPEVISPIGVEVLGPVPRRASSVQLPVSSRRKSASPSMQEVRRAGTAVMIATSMTNQCRGCSHSVMFRLPHWLDPQVAPTAEPQVFWAAGPCTPRNAHAVTHHGRWYRYVSESGN